MDGVCRVCLANENLTCLFRTRDSDLPQKIMTCTSVSIRRDDRLPSQICAKCIERLNISYDFKILCERSDQLLRTKIRIEENFEEDKTVPKYDSDDSTADDAFAFSNLSDEIDKESKIGRKKCSKIVKRSSRLRIPKSTALHEQIDIKKSFCIEETRELREERENQNLNCAKHNDCDENESQQFPLKKRHKILDKRTYKLDNKNANKTRKKEQCITCGKIMSSRFRLKMHMRIHTGEKPFVCKYCSKTFSLSQNLKVHERVHTGEKPLLCNSCGKGFAQSSALTAHVRIHTGETPYKCVLCNMSFRTPGHLQYHIKQHTGEKNYECEVCNKAFIAKGDLTQHKKTHTGERPFICTICGIRMSRSSHLTRHMITHSGKKPHSCHSCGLSYAHKGDLVRHMRKFPNDGCKIVDTLNVN